jgi:hypothetical protein
MGVNSQDFEGCLNFHAPFHALCHVGSLAQLLSSSSTAKLRYSVGPLVGRQEKDDAPMTTISMDGATTAASDPAPDGALAAPENHAILCESAHEKAVWNANEEFYQAWRLIVQRHASGAAESLKT